MTTPALAISISRSPLRLGLPLIPLVLVCFALSPTARAVSPPPDGGYPNQNTAEGENALFSLTTGDGNTALGYASLRENTTGRVNTAVGADSMPFTTTGSYNTAVGASALLFNETGSANTAIGSLAMFFNESGSSNTAVGYYALAGTGGGVTTNNTAIGDNALNTMTWGNQNTASGSGALSNNIGGSNNTATGFAALGGLISASEASNNTADGANALYSNITGINNTASGVDALHDNASGNYNSAHGQGALFANTSGSNNTGIGRNALLANTTGTSNIALGESAGSALTTGKNNIDIGNVGKAGESAKIRIGNKAHKNTYIAGISGVTVAGGVAVVADTNGQLGTITSSARYKEAIQPMDASSEAILSLQPVKFRYKKELDAQGIPQFGLVAEDVAKVNPDLVARDEAGNPYTVRYEAVNAMLLNEFLKEHRGVQDLTNTVARQEVMIAQQQKEIGALTAALKAQGAQIQKVSDQLRTQAPAARVVAEN